MQICICIIIYICNYTYTYMSHCRTNCFGMEISSSTFSVRIVFVFLNMCSTAYTIVTSNRGRQPLAKMGRCWSRMIISTIVSWFYDLRIICMFRFQQTPYFIMIVQWSLACPNNKSRAMNIFWNPAWSPKKCIWTRNLGTVVTQFNWPCLERLGVPL